MKHEDCPFESEEARKVFEAELLTQIEDTVADRIFPRRWLAVLALLFTSLLGIVTYNWTQLDARVSAIESFVGDQRGVNARRDVAMAQMADDIKEIRRLLENSETKLDAQTRENATMIREILRRMR